MTTYYNYLGQAMAVSANPVQFAQGSSGGHETLTAPIGPSGLSTGGGNYDTLIGSSGDNIFYLNNITDVVQVADGLSGVKTVVSYSGGYTLPANVQNLTFYGAGNWGAGNNLDNLIVMGGNDQNTMDGGGGDDVLVGGFGQNNIGFEVGGGHDVIYNFHTNLDTVRIAGAGFKSFGQIQSAMRQVGSDVVLTIDANDSITFRKVSVGDFQAKNFLMPLDRGQLGALTFSDDFNSLQLWNASTRQGLWQTNFGGDPTKLDTYAITSNDEKQVYTAPDFVGQNGYSLAAYNPFSINNGVMGITAGQFSYADSQHTWGQAYYSGMLNTRGLYMQKYGYFEMRAELPTALGTWPAFWLSQDPYKPGVEADVLEHLAMYPDVNFARVVDGGIVTGNTNFAMPSLSGFHTYGMLWGPSTTTFYIDDLAVMQVATPASWDKPMYMLLDMAVGGWGGPIDAGALPAQMSVDYVHVYGLASTPVQVSVGLPTYAAPFGVDSVTLIGSDQTVIANDSGDQLIGTAGADIFVLGKGGDTVSGGGGADVFRIDAVPWTASRISDFAADDRLDLAGLLMSLGYSGGSALADGMLKLTAEASSGAAQVWAKTGAQWSLVTTLTSVAPTALHLQGQVLVDVPGDPALQTPQIHRAAVASDLNGDAVSDVVFRNPSSGAWGFTTLDSAGNATWHNMGGSDASYAVVGKGDFNGDGVTDLLYRDSAGSWGYLALASGGGQSWHPMGGSDPTYGVAGVGDFNADGISDILYRNSSTGDWGYTTLDGSDHMTWHAMGGSDASYAVVGVGDFNADGVSDILYRNSAGDWGYTTLDTAGHMNWRFMGGSDATYTVVGVADFNADGVSDIAYRNNSTGAWGYSTLDGAGHMTWHDVGASDASYAIVTTGDYNGDGYADLLFRNNSTGAYGYDALQGGGGVTWHSVTTSDPSFFVV